MKEKYPCTDENNDEAKVEGLQGITYKGKSRKYISAYNKMKEKMIKGAEFKVKTKYLKVLDTPKYKPMKV